MSVKQIPKPEDRAFEQDKPIGKSIVTPRQGIPLEYGWEHRQSVGLPASHIVDIGLI
jgi:hypothetical protein